MQKKSKAQKFFSVIACLLFLVTAGTLFVHVSLEFTDAFLVAGEEIFKSIAENSASVVGILKRIFIDALAKPFFRQLPYMFLGIAAFIAAIVSLTKKKKAAQIVCGAFFVLATVGLPIIVFGKPLLVLSFVPLAAANILGLFLSIASVSNDDWLKKGAKVVRVFFIGLLVVFVAASTVFVTINFIDSILDIVIGFFSSIENISDNPYWAIIFREIFGFVAVLLKPLFYVNFAGFALSIATALALKQFATSDYKPDNTEELALDLGDFAEEVQVIDPPVAELEDPQETEDVVAIDPAEEETAVYEA